jgi:hypothetical protein
MLESPYPPVGCDSSRGQLGRESLSLESSRLLQGRPAPTDRRLTKSADEHEKNHNGGEKDQAEQGDPRLRIPRLRGCVPSNSRPAESVEEFIGRHSDLLTE